MFILIAQPLPELITFCASSYEGKPAFSYILGKGPATTSPTAPSLPVCMGNQTETLAHTS